MENASFPSQTCVIDPEELANALSVISSLFTDESEGRRFENGENMLAADRDQQPTSGQEPLLNSIMFALRDWCHEESSEKYTSLCWRLFALSDLIHQGALDEWVVKDGQSGFFTIPGIIIRVAATLPLKNGQGFNPRVFLQAVEKLLT